MLTAEGFVPPGPADFELPPVFGEVTKPMLLLVMSVFLIVGLTYAMARKSEVVPGRLQFAGEYVYGFVRNSIARDSIGSEHFLKYVPYLFALFTFVLVNNYYGLIPILQYPTMARSGFVYGIAALSWLLYNGVGIAKHGFVGYFKHQSVPAGVGGPILILLVPLEFASNILVRPVTLSLRLFANMFAGHLLLMLFSLGGAYLIMESGNIWYMPVGVLSYFMGLMVSVLEMLVMFLQAYVFTLLTAMYIGGAVSEEH